MCLLFICEFLCLRLYFHTLLVYGPSSFSPLIPFPQSAAFPQHVWASERAGARLKLVAFADLCLIGALAVYQETSVCIFVCLSGCSRSLLLRQMHRCSIDKQWSMSPRRGFSHWLKVSGFEYLLRFLPIYSISTSSEMGKQGGEKTPESLKSDWEEFKHNTEMSFCVCKSVCWKLNGNSTHLNARV